MALVKNPTALTQEHVTLLNTWSHSTIEWGSHVRLSHIFKNRIGNVCERQKCDLIEHAGPTLALHQYRTILLAYFIESKMIWQPVGPCIIIPQ